MKDTRSRTPSRLSVRARVHLRRGVLSAADAGTRYNVPESISSPGCGRPSHCARGGSPPSRACWPDTASIATKAVVEHLSGIRTARPVGCRRRGLRSHDAVQSDVRVLLRRALLNIEGEWRQELPLDMLRRAFPDQRPAGQPDRRRNLHAEGHPRRHGGVPARRATSAGT